MEMIYGKAEVNKGNRKCEILVLYEILVIYL